MMASAMWTMLGQVSIVAQLVGVDALGLLSIFLLAALAARRHRDTRHRLAQHVEIVVGLLHELEHAELMRRQATRRPLQQLRAALQGYYDLVTGCQDNGYLRSLFLGARMTEELGAVEQEIDMYIRLVLLLALVDTTNDPHSTQAALVLNTSRRFRYTLDLKKNKKEISTEFRAEADVIRAAAFCLNEAGQICQLPHMEGATGCGAGVHVVSRRMVRPFTPPAPAPTVNGSNGCHPPTVSGNGCHRPKEEAAEVIHLTPWDLRLISIDYIQKGILLPKPPSSVGDNDNDLVNALQSSFARALRLFYPFAGRLASEEHADDGTVSLFLRCTGEGAEFVHAVAPEVAVADIISSVYTPPVVWKFFPLALVLGADAAIKGLPVLAVQVTVLADGVFIGMTLNHSAGDGTAFWHFFNTWSEIHRAGGGVGIVSADQLGDLSTPPPVFDRWFLETCPVPIPLPFPKLEDIVRRFERTPVKECFFTFLAASVKKLKVRANDEMAGRATASISSLQAVLAHFWRAVCRARRLTPEQSTFYSVVVGCRGRVNGIPPVGYLGNALVFGKAEATAGEIEEKGLGWTAWLLNRAVASFDEAAMRESLERWVREPDFTYMDNLSSAGTALVTGSSPRFDVFGNDFGWGKPLAVRSGSGNKADGKATVFEGPERGGSISLEVCIAPDALERLVADQEFMDAVSTPAA